MLLNLNNCSVLKPQGYSSLQSISETERYELKNILTFAFCWAEKLVHFFWTSPRHTVCWEGQCFGLVNHKVSSSLSGTEISPFSSSTRPKPWLQSTFPPPTRANEGLFLCLPHMCLTRGCVCFLVVFSISWRGELGAASRTHELVLLVLARSGPAGTFWGELWALCRHRWHSKAWTWSWTPQKCEKHRLNPSQDTCHKVKIFSWSWWRAKL